MIAQNFGRWNPRRTWRTASNVDKVRLYTRQSFIMVAVVFGGFGAVTEIVADRYLSGVFLGISAVACVIAVSRMPDLGGVVAKPVQIPLAVMTLSAFCSAGIALGSNGENGPYFWLAAILVVPLAGLTSLRWLIVGSVAAGVVLGLLAGPESGVSVGIVAAFMGLTVYMSVWLLRMVTELDEARGAAAALSVAEERLRFSRDLHDVVGRALSAIAVKSELAATLSRRGDDRAAAQMDEVRELAQDSLDEARELVRGYRSIALASELAGAQSLLEAAGISTAIRGSADQLPVELAEAAAWVVREGVTNILRHSSAENCSIEVFADGVVIANDGARIAEPNNGTGLNGLRERVGAVGGTVETVQDEDRFTLTAHFPVPNEGVSVTEPIKVLLADDENLIRSALAMMLSLEDDIVVVAEAESGEDAVVAAAKHQPDVAVLDLQMAGIDGIETAQQIAQTVSGCVSIIVTSHGRPGYLKKALSAGVRGFLPKTTPAATLAEVVRSVHAGGRYVDPSLAAEAIGAGDSPLTPREADVLEYAADGASIEQIASRAHLSAGTTRNYLSSAVTKLGAANRHEAAVIARRQGWI